MAPTASLSSSSRRRAARARPSRGGTDALLARLTRVKPGKHRVVTCYLKLEPRDRVRGKYLIKLKNRVKAVAEALPRLGLTRGEVEPVLRDLQRVVEALRDPAKLPTARGIAIFASEPIGLFEVQPLPVVHRSRLAVDRTPLVKELASIEDEFGRLLTVVLDRTGARFFEVGAFGATELPGIRADSTRGGRFRGDQDGPGWGEHNYHNRIREEKQRHHEMIARTLFALDRRQPVHGIVLAAPGPDAQQVRPFLHPYLADRLIGTAKLSPKEATAARVHELTLETRAAWERAEETAWVNALGDKLGPGWAVAGVAETLRALARGQVRTLLVDADLSLPGFRSQRTGRLALTEKELQADGQVVPVLDVVDDAIEEALRQHVDVNVVYEDDARAAILGLAAFLRFR